MSEKHLAMAIQCYVSSMVLYSRQLPPGYLIALWFDSEGYSTQLLDPDETRIDREGPQDFAQLVEIAQMHAARRASDGLL